MSLKLPYRSVFYHKILRPLKLWAVLEDLDSRISGEESETPVTPSLEDLGLELVEAVVTYEDESTETLKIVVESSSKD